MAHKGVAKASLRARLKAARLEMLDEAHRLASAQIVERLKTVLDWSKVTSAHYFEPIAELAEVDINGFIRYLEDSFPDMRLATSRKIEDTWEVIGVHGGQPPAQFEVMIVPMLGFEPKGLHRIGYGGGYYDQLIATQSQSQTVGVCFELGKVQDLPTEPHDRPLEMIITEAKIYR